MSKRLPRGFRRDHDDSVICPHRDLSCCDECASKHEEIIEVVGRHYWVADKKERDELLKCEADYRAAEKRRAEEQPTEPAPAPVAADIVEVMIHAAEPESLPAAAGIEIVNLNERVGSCAGSMVALYGDHAAVVQYVARIWGLSDPAWFAENVVLGAHPFHAEGRVITNDAGRRFLVRVVRKGERYGLNDKLVHDGGASIGKENDPLIEFYDLTHCDKFGPRGQFVSRYYASTLATHNGGLTLDGGCHVWSVDARAMQPVIALAKSLRGGAL